MTDVIYDAATDRDALRPCPVGTRIQTLIFDREMFTPGQTEIWAKRHGFKHSGLDVKAYTVRVRQESPGDFIEGSMRTITLRAGVKAVIGCPKSSVREEAKETATVAQENPLFGWQDWKRFEQRPGFIEWADPAPKTSKPLDRA